MLGKDIHSQMKRCPNKKFTMKTAVRVALDMFLNIRSFHKMGFIHRDIKMNNFVSELPSKNEKDEWQNSKVVLIDYGICKNKGAWVKDKSANANQFKQSNY